jgi:hypothetical protein
MRECDYQLDNDLNHYSQGTMLTQDSYESALGYTEMQNDSNGWWISAGVMMFNNKPDTGPNGSQCQPQHPGRK